jgi:putative addiction module killer protein
MIEVLEYIRNDGHCPFADWFHGLDHQAAAKVATALERMKAGNFGDHKSVGGGVWERRINFGPGYRIYFGRDGARIVVLVGGGTKSRQSSDIQRAQVTWADYKATKS